MDQLTRNHQNPRSVSGCVMALSYWPCEKTGIVNPRNANATPALLKWNLQDIDKWSIQQIDEFMQREGNNPQQERQRIEKGKKRNSQRKKTTTAETEPIQIEEPEQEPNKNDSGNQHNDEMASQEIEQQTNVQQLQEGKQIEIIYKRKNKQIEGKNKRRKKTQSQEKTSVSGSSTPLNISELEEQNQVLQITQGKGEDFQEEEDVDLEEIATDQFHFEEHTMNVEHGSEIEELKEEIKKRDVGIQNLQHDVDSFSRLKEKDKEIVAAEVALSKELEQEKVQLEKQLEKANARIEELEISQANLIGQVASQQGIEDLEKQNEGLNFELEQALANIQTLQAVKKTAEDKQEAAVQARTELQEPNPVFQITQGKAQDFQEEIQHLKEEIKKRNIRIQKLEHDLSSYSDKEVIAAEEKVKLEKQLEKANARIEELEINQANLIGQVASQQGIEDLQREKESLNIELEQALAKIQRLEEMKKTPEDQREAAVEEMMNAQTEIEELKKEKQDMIHNFEVLKNIENENQQEIKEFKK